MLCVLNASVLFYCASSQCIKRNIQPTPMNAVLKAQCFIIDPLGKSSQKSSQLYSYCTIDIVTEQLYLQTLINDKCSQTPPGFCKVTNLYYRQTSLAPARSSYASHMFPNKWIRVLRTLSYKMVIYILRRVCGRVWLKILRGRGIKWGRFWRTFQKII